MSDADNSGDDWKQIQVVIEGAAGKRIRQLLIQEPPDPGMNDFVICVSCDDGTHISIELSALLKLSVFHEQRVDGNFHTVKAYPERVLE